MLIEADGGQQEQEEREKGNGGEKGVNIVVMVDSGRLMVVAGCRAQQERRLGGRGVGGRGCSGWESVTKVRFSSFIYHVYYMSWSHD